MQRGSGETWRDPEESAVRFIFMTEYEKKGGRDLSVCHTEPGRTYTGAMP